ncbi:hypothetical protein B0A49_00945 [Cryomyces minteri]|uniref:FAM50A/XAP5 C-terminal domain-containing protein n=1 Tax=Cryomyces minteri TaxID=331657 RepID=A0A4U0XT44_9PEZI|nr:hypothetical protein B0A49_00945 [Cryomyces minteri]
MESSAPSSATPSRSSTPNPASRFTSQQHTAEDLLKQQTVGLVHLSDFRKRRVEALEQKEREAQEKAAGRSGTSTPRDGEAEAKPPKKKRKPAKKGALSFGLDEEEDGDTTGTSAAVTPRSSTPDGRASKATTPGAEDSDEAVVGKKRLGPNAKVGVAPKVMTKSALIREAQTRELLRKEYLSILESVKATEIVLPFVFYDGSNVPGGVCKVKKGDYIWLFLDRARKVGAETGGGGGDKSRREWARVGVDDLMLVRGEIIIPHHYEFYYFIVNRTLGFNGPLFPFSAQPTSTTPSASTPSTPSGLTTHEQLSRANATKKKANAPSAADAELEGYHDDATLTKVVDRRWYERNKHIYPASIWEEFDPGKDYSKGIRKDTEGNAFFFSS